MSVATGVARWGWYLALEFGEEGVRGIAVNVHLRTRNTP